MTLSGAVLAGGRSRRMGSDKAQLIHPIDRVPLWERQWNLLRSLDLENIVVSPGSLDTTWIANRDELTAVEDIYRDLGPLSGIVACLEMCTTDALLVVAVDLVQMRASFLQSLISLYRGQEGRGVVFAGPKGFEPLCAVYSATLAALGLSMLQSKELRLQDFVRRGEDLGAMVSHQLDGENSLFFENPNTPEEWEAFCSIHPTPS